MNEEQNIPNQELELTEGKSLQHFPGDSHAPQPQTANMETHAYGFNKEFTKGISPGIKKSRG
jgi:hypothetical protein